MDKFLTAGDELGMKIQEQSVTLFNRLQKLDVDRLGMPYHCLEYFKGSHFKRLFFSIETSAHLLYRSIKTSGKKLEDTIIMDYGAGVGTLYTLAKMIGCKQVIYNDHLEDWKTSAQLIAEAIEVRVDEYITGDIEETLLQLSRKNIRCTIITSRNVLEHIYKLDKFFTAVAEKQPTALVYSSTTANYKNPGSRIKHKRWHEKWEKIFLPKREEMIEAMAPNLSAEKRTKLAIVTRGRAMQDLTDSVNLYTHSGKYPVVVAEGSNTCDPENGVWFENMLSFDTYRKLIGKLHYSVGFEPGFWDTHYQKNWKNVMAKILNRLILSNKELGFQIAPFIYVIAKPNSDSLKSQAGK
ncbi:MAG: hypothetical protein H7Y31_08910 [Chitinophagaceae bacterium]|nr:hypothetical protein [Chitinophagaceae bacterium]